VLKNELNLLELAAEYRNIAVSKFPLANAFGLGCKETLDMDIPFLPQDQVIGSGEV
jgi:hypothetical protein